MSSSNSAIYFPEASCDFISPRGRSTEEGSTRLVWRRGQKRRRPIPFSGTPHGKEVQRSASTRKVLTDLATGKAPSKETLPTLVKDPSCHVPADLNLSHLSGRVTFPVLTESTDSESELSFSKNGYSKGDRDATPAPPPPLISSREPPSCCLASCCQKICSLFLQLISYLKAFFCSFCCCRTPSKQPYTKLHPLSSESNGDLTLGDLSPIGSPPSSHFIDLDSDLEQDLFEEEEY